MENDIPLGIILYTVISKWIPSILTRKKTFFVKHNAPAATKKTPRFLEQRSKSMSQDHDIGIMWKGIISRAKTEVSISYGSKLIAKV